MSGPILASGLAHVQEVVRLLPADKTIAVVVVADPRGVEATIIAGKDTESGRWQFAGQIEKLRARPDVHWSATLTWSR